MSEGFCPGMSSQSTFIDSVASATVVMTMMLVIIMIGEKDCLKGGHERNPCSG